MKKAALIFITWFASASIHATELIDDYVSKCPWLEDYLKSYELKGYQAKMNGVWESDFPKEIQKQSDECKKWFKETECKVLMSAYRIGYYGRK